MHFLAPRFLVTLLVCGAAAPLSAEKPATLSPPSPTLTNDALIDTMSAADLQQVIPLLKSNFINPEALSEVELDRAMLAGLTSRLGRGVQLLASSEAPGAAAPTPFFSEILDGHIGYLRLGNLTPANLQAMDATLQTFAGKNVDALAVDLRASGESADFNMAAEYAKRFAPKSKPLFTLRKPTAKQERIFTSDRDPGYAGMLIVLADGETAGAAEALAGVLHHYSKAMVIGTPTAGRAVEYADLPLPSGKILRVAVAEVVLPDGRSLFPDGLKADLQVEMSPAEKRQVFGASAEKGMSQFVFEKERPHLNEAALLAGTNPELDAAEVQRRRGAEKTTLRDPVVQRAVDLVTSLAIYGKR